MIKNDRLIKRNMAQMAILVSLFLALGPAEINGAEKKAGANREPLELTRVANSGVMLASGKIKILIDALFDKPPSDYRSPEPEVFDKIMKGAAPFDDVDLALTTHNHPDHFDAPLAVRFLEVSPKALLIAPEDAVAEMRKEAAWKEIAGRVVSLDLKIGEQEQREIAGVSIAARRTLHSGKREEPMNLMLRLRLNGWNVFHEGDADATLDEYRGFGLEEAEIDLALVHFWFPLHPEMAKLLQEIIRPEHIGLTHLPIRLENDAPGKIDMVRKNYQDIFLLLPGMPVKVFTDAAEQLRPLHALVLLGEWFGDAYFPLQKEIESRGWTQKRTGVDAEYRGCYKKERDVVLTSDILIPDLKDFSGFDCLIIPSGPQFRKFKENPSVLEFLRKAHNGGMLIASFCVGNNLIKAAGLVDLPYGPALFPEKVTLVRERILLGPKGGGPPPGDGFQNAPIKELCDAIASELNDGKAKRASPILKGAYLGQKPPGMTPEHFGVGIIDNDERIFAITFSSDGKECFYTKSLRTNTIMTARETNGQWSEPKIADFSGQAFDFEPHISPDGKRMIFGSMRALPGEKKDDLHQWQLEKTAGGWSEPNPLGSPFKDGFCMYVSVAASGNIYFTGEDGIYLAKFSNGHYSSPEKLPDAINRLQYAAHPFIAPDESYLIFDAQPQEGNAELFISFRDAAGAWTVPQKLDSRFNTDCEDMCAFVSRDGKYFFFSRLSKGKGDIYWVDARFIESLKPKPRIDQSIKGGEKK